MSEVLARLEKKGGSNGVSVDYVINNSASTTLNCKKGSVIVLCANIRADPTVVGASLLGASETYTPGNSIYFNIRTYIATEDDPTFSSISYYTGQACYTIIS